jgi:hypothetical protein|nr:MAG TPA: Protein of unknown function (DUF2612) [Caudoviricetes sp.]DAO80751.1 MAG TPA: Protein of unknown function (DUF2612) [Caudoviricetes sp.]
MKVLDNWLNDIPYQFQNKKNIEVLIKAFSRQLSELENALISLNLNTDILSAKGKNLDMIGDIVNLSRIEAAKYTGKLNITLEDEVYRRLLIYKKLLNTNECTYYDVIQGIKLIWGTSSPVYYKEKPERPATIFLTMPNQSLDKEYKSFVKTLNIKPAGVSLVYETVYDDLMYLLYFEIFNVERVRFSIYEKIAQKIDRNGNHLIFVNEKNAVTIGSFIENKKGTENYDIWLTTDINPWFLNGETLFDGSKVLNSKIWKESI